VRVRSTTISGIAGGVIVAGCAALLVFQGLRTHTLPELLERAQADPKDASVQVELGHVYFEAGQRVAALKAYDKALQLDRDAATRRMLENLVSCYGSRQMGPAGAIITRYKLEDSEDELRALISNRKRPVRHGVLSTLDGLGKARRDDFLTVYMLDLASTDCDVRRVAVEKLGRLGDRRALAAIRTANRKDEANTPWYALSCLGSRPENAEKAILASR
jgi:tetratricopeptide (TPR) repeat protein